jgi:hypothetical protein
MSPHHFSYLRNIEIEPSSRYFLLASFCRCMMRTSLLHGAEMLLILFLDSLLFICSPTTARFVYHFIAMFHHQARV